MNVAQQEIDYGELGKALLAQIATGKSAGTTPTTIYGHGPGGLFSNPGVNPNIVNAFSYACSGLLTKLPWRASRYYNELLGRRARAGASPLPHVRIVSSLATSSSATRP
jgi:hypothetical protein